MDDESKFQRLLNYDLECNQVVIRNWNENEIENLKRNDMADAMPFGKDKIRFSLKDEVVYYIKRQA